MSKELKNIFDTEYSKSVLTDFAIKTEKIYDFFNYDFKLNKNAINRYQDKFKGAKVWLNEDYRNSAISNLKIVEFELTYPKIIANIAETNLEKFNEVYSKVIDHYLENKEYTTKKYINSTYGCLQNPNSTIFSNNIHLVPIHLNHMLTRILNEFKGHIIYIDTNSIFFRNFEEIEERFKNYFDSINKYDLTYTIESSNFGYFSNKKKYMIEKDGDIKTKGLQHFNKNGMSRGDNIKLSSMI